MTILTEKEYELFQRLVSMTQTQLYNTLNLYLKEKYNKVINDKKYILAIGDIPIALVAHLDTVFEEPVEHLYYDQYKGVMWSPEGLGADDRAGIFAILRIIQTGLRPSIILTLDEEKGGLGAKELSKIQNPFPDLKYLIQLDRCGSNDCVFYSCANPQFKKYIEEFGFTEKIGTYSDISFLMPAWKVCGVNLSIGYNDEHTFLETLNINDLYRTIIIVCNMLKSVNQDLNFNYEEQQCYLSKNYKKNSSLYYEDDIDFLKCSHCGKSILDFELIPVKSKSSKKMVYYCPDCIADKVGWCERCGNPYELWNTEEDIGYCKDCLEILTDGKS